MRPGGNQLTASEQGSPQGVVGLEQQVRVLQALGQAQELLPQRPPRLVFSSRTIRMPESPQHAEDLRWLPHLLTQLPGADIEPFHLWGCLALGDPQHRAEGHLHSQLLLAGRVASRSRAAVKWLTASA